MALEPVIAAELRRLAAIAYQPETMTGKMLHVAVELLAKKAETGIDQDTDELESMIVPYGDEKGVGIDFDYWLNYKAVAVQIIAECCFGPVTPPDVLDLQVFMEEILQQRGGPGASNKNMLLAYINDNLLAITQASEEPPPGP